MVRIEFLSGTYFKLATISFLLTATPSAYSNPWGLSWLFSFHYLFSNQFKRLVDVFTRFCTSARVLETIFASILLGFFKFNSPWRQIAFISCYDNWGVLFKILSQLESPLFYLWKRVYVSLIINNESTSGLTVIDSIQSMITFLACRIPNIHVYRRAIHTDLFIKKWCV